MEITRKIIRSVVDIIKLLFKRLPVIALYALSIAVLWAVFHFAYITWDKDRVEAAPVTDYLKYTSFTVPNFREGEDFTYSVCRDFKGSYHATGKRKIYLVPQGQSTNNRVFLTSSTFNGIIEGNPCQSYIIKDSKYHLKPGQYQLGLSTDITVQYGVVKHSAVDSNVFTVRAQPDGSTTDLQAQINNLSNQLDQLRSLSQPSQLQGETQIDGPTAQPSASASPSPSSSASHAQPSTSSTAPVKTNPVAKVIDGISLLLGGAL